MTEKIINDLAEHISKYILGKHKLGTAHKIINYIWDIAYEHGYENGKVDALDI
jgi:hypothetical protein